MLKQNQKARQMQNQPLKLNSYKIDTSQLESKMQQIDILKEQLQKTISSHRQEQQELKYQINSVQRENQKLKKQIRELKLTNQTQHALIQQLQDKVTSSQELNQKYQEELEYEEERYRQMEKQLNREIDRLKQEKQEMHNQLFIQSSSQKHGFRTKDQKNSNFSANQISSQQSVTDSQLSVPSNSSKKVKRLKRSSSPQPQRVVRNSVQPKQKYKINNSIPQRQQDSNISAEDIYLEMIRLLYKQLIKIQLKSKDILKIPIIDSFAQIASPNKKDFNRLVSNYPFQIKQNHKLNLIFDFVYKEIERKGRSFTGEQIIFTIIKAVEEIQLEKDISLHSGLSSAMLSESQMYQNNSGFRRVSKPGYQTQHNYPYEYNDPISESISESSRQGRYHR